MKKQIQNIFELPFMNQVEGLIQIAFQKRLLEGVISINVKCCIFLISETVRFPHVLCFCQVEFCNCLR